MIASAQSHPLPYQLRLVLGVITVLLVGGVLLTMTTLSQPSQSVAAEARVIQGPGRAADLLTLSVLNFNRVLYLEGRITPAAGPATASLFTPDSHPVLAPATFADASGAVEILAHDLPLLAGTPVDYHFGESLHLLGWRTSSSGLTLFAAAKTKPELLTVLRAQSAHWRAKLFWQGLLLAGLIFSAFWLLAMSLLSQPTLGMVEFLIINLIFLVLYHSVLVLSAYPLLTILPQTLVILIVANAVFAAPVVLGRKHAP